jgi:OPA family glycerol-3-phosphate transporter-like MFS transporter
MFHSLIAWFNPAPARPRLPPEEVAQRYPKFRWQIFEAAFIAYALFYIVRNNFAPVSKEIGEALHYDKSMLGDILLGTSIAYGLGKLFMGFLADRSDSRKYIAVGMLLTAGINFIFGATFTFYGHVLLWTLNGFVQGMGYGPCARGLSHWYSIKERGTIFGFWNISHNIGGGIAGVLAARCAELWGWRSAFYVPGIIAVIGAIYLFWRMRDTPQAEGLPPVEEYKNDWPPEEKQRHEKELTFKEMFLENILPNKMLWILAIANIFVYIARYAMVDWGPTYLKEVKGASLLAGGFSTLVIEFAGAAGMLTMGWLSDKIGGRRARVSVLAMIPLLLAFTGLILTGSLFLTVNNIKKPDLLVQQLQSGTNSVGTYIWGQFPEKARLELSQDTANRQALLTLQLNRLLTNPATLYEPDRFAGVALRERTRTLLDGKHKGGELIYFNRLLLEDAFPDHIGRSHFTLKGLLWWNFTLFAVIGFFVYTPVMFSGVMALDLTSKKAAATAAGFVGFFGYLGRVIQGKGLAVVAQEYGWNAGLAAVIGCILLGIFLLALLWNVRPRG